jgi:signal transduction histidine kinase
LLQAVGQVGVVLENSALLQGKLELERTLARQAQIVQLGEMTARIAHEIKNPLSSIKTIVQVMREEPATSSLHGRDLELIEGEVNRLSATVTQLLNFARPGREAQDRVRLRQAVEATVSFLQHDIRRMGARIENEVPEDLPAIEGSEAAFREILLNLILNSIQAGGGGMRVRLQGWLGMFEDGSEEFVVFIVEDDGPGVPADLQERVFQPFFTTKQRGTGLGLAIVRRNVEQMGGRIALESPARQGNGTRFIIHLPLRPRAAPEQARPYRNGS